MKMKMKIAIGIALLLGSMSTQAARLHYEAVYQNAWCEGKGETEFRLSDATRVDCLTDNYAIEFDFADKWAECIGQTLHYSRMTIRLGMCILIIEDWERDVKYVNRVRDLIKWNPSLAFEVRVVSASFPLIDVDIFKF